MSGVDPPKSQFTQGRCPGQALPDLWVPLLSSQTPGSFADSLLGCEEGLGVKGSYSLSSLLLDEARDTMLLLTL